MTKIIFISIQLIVLLFVVLLIVDNTFIVSFEIDDFIYSLSSPYFFGLLIFLFIFIFIIQTIYFRIINRFHKYKMNRYLEKQKIGYEYFTLGMVALANKDYKKASSFSQKLNRFLKDDRGLPLLLYSEVLKKTKNFDKLKTTYNEMLNIQTTKELGEIGLMEYYLSLQDYHHAFLYAERLFIKNPNIENLYNNILQIIAKTNNWSQLLRISKKAFENKIISKTIYQEHRSIALFEIAKIKFQNDINEAITLTKEAVKLRSFFVPYIKFLVNLLLTNNNIREAKKFIIQAWNENPNTELRKFIIEISNKFDLDIIKFVSSFKNINVKNEQNKLLLSHACVINKKWTDAREHIKSIMSNKPSKEICEIMSMIELGENNDLTKSNSWKIRSENAELENCWICTITNQPHQEWSSVSKAGYFNSLEWKQLSMVYQNEIERIQIEN
tara:strand:+ start:3879 stop:5201 length:1323 start_codon:yes stop_codon:yes gene_type:complete